MEVYELGDMAAGSILCIAQEKSAIYKSFLQSAFHSFLHQGKHPR